MPNFVLGRTHTLSSKQGHIINFVKGQPTWVPPECVPEVVAIGGECVEGPIDVLPPEVQEAIPLTHDEREQLVFEAFKDLISTNNPDNFTAAGVPKQKVVAKVSGVDDIDSKEVVTLWQKYREAQAEGQ